MFKFLEFITEGFGSLQIVLSLSVIGFGLGFLAYYLIPNTAGFIIGIVITLIGLVAGVIMATRIWKKKGTINFLSRISGTPELDEVQKDEK